MSSLAFQIMSDITVFSKYAKYLPELKRRETWCEVITRNMNMHLKKYPQLKLEIINAYQYVYNKKVLPSMRSLQFAGRPIELNPSRLYNCAALPMDNYFAFAEVMFLLLGGTGVGYSVQQHHVEKLPYLQKPIKRKRRCLIADSIEGWADAIKVLMKAYFYGLSDPVFDFSSIRPKGSPIKTAGGKAPGPQPLKDCIHNIKALLDQKSVGDKLRPIEVHDICCHIADAVLSGGIRRSACISLFSFDDEEMITCKYGDWSTENSQRSRANNSAVALRHRIKKSDFMDLWKKIELGKAGEPAIYFSNSSDVLTNPCNEASVTKNFCNLTEVNSSTIVNQQDLNKRAKVAAFIGTLQSGYTDFYYLRDFWKERTEKEALLGVGVTGIAGGNFLGLNMREAANVVLQENERVAKILGTNLAARTTVVKPAGTSSCVLMCSSGIHDWYDEYYIRRMILNKEEPIYEYLVNKIPNLVEDSFYKPNLEAVVSLPIKAPNGALTRRNSNAISLLERVKFVYENWIKPGHRSGDNTHNVSCTVSVKPEEWKGVREWLWRNRNNYNGVATLPYDGGSYPQLPFESCSKYMHDKLSAELVELDLTEVIETKDNTEVRLEPACAGGHCDDI